MRIEPTLVESWADLKIQRPRHQPIFQHQKNEIIIIKMLPVRFEPSLVKSSADQKIEWCERKPMFLHQK